MSQRLQFVVPPGPDLHNGNLGTARRWAGIVRSLGHRANVQNEKVGCSNDILVALNAIKSFAAIRQFHDEHPDRPIVVALTGTDVYGSRSIVPALERASAIVVLQKDALSLVPKRFRKLTHVIYQSAQPLARSPKKPVDRFQVAVIGHLRGVKDPFRTALAVRRLPPQSRISIVQVGRALTPSMADRARRENKKNDRYCWVGETSANKARRILAASHLTVISSRVEGSSNVLSEALVSDVPVLASRIPGLIGTLGRKYPGFYPYGDTAALRKLLQRAETETKFLNRLRREGGQIAPLVSPEREVRDWAGLLETLI